MSLPHVCLPIEVDAFVLNENVVSAKQPTQDKKDDQGIALVPPITQPNYVNLRLSNDQIQHDLLPRIDVHKSRDPSTNPRLSTLYQQPFRNTTALDPAPAPASTVGVVAARKGVYLHWSVPRGYRSAVSEAASPPKYCPRQTGYKSITKIPTCPQPMVNSQTPIARMVSTDREPGPCNSLGH
jgi:hypothetical protein